MKQVFLRITAALFALGLLLALAPTSAARPEYYERFMADPLRSTEAEGCNVCHLDQAGGGPRGEFGTEFEEAGLVITSMMRASFPELFDVPVAPIGELGLLHFSDPDNRNAVVEIGGERYVVEIPTTALTVVGEDAAEESDAGTVTAPENFSFFLTSEGPGRGGNLGGIAGADRHCQSLAETVGAGNRSWKAYLSTSFESQPAIHAGDRIGAGPWHNIKGIRIARGVADLHSEHNNLNAETALTETGGTIEGVGGSQNRHDILTGTLQDGTASEATCNNWTSGDEGETLVGHFDRQGGGDFATSWNAAHLSAGCSQQSLESTGGGGLFYCFASD
jgi:hypothetical protein